MARLHWLSPRRAVATIPGISVAFGQPISHRIEHMVSGAKANLAVKIFGTDLPEAFQVTNCVEERGHGRGSVAREPVVLPSGRRFPCTRSNESSTAQSHWS